jgi:ABC-type nickel/cobalt efflux system permease component RcnA
MYIFSFWPFLRRHRYYTSTTTTTPTLLLADVIEHNYWFFSPTPSLSMCAGVCVSWKRWWRCRRRHQALSTGKLKKKKKRRTCSAQIVCGRANHATGSLPGHHTHTHTQNRPQHHHHHHLICCCCVDSLLKGGRRRMDKFLFSSR